MVCAMCAAFLLLFLKEEKSASRIETLKVLVVIRDMAPLLSQVSLSESMMHSVPTDPFRISLRHPSIVAFVIWGSKSDIRIGKKRHNFRRRLPLS